MLPIMKGVNIMCAANLHLDQHERQIIQRGLDNNHSFKQIGRDIDKDCTTVSKEVRKNSLEICVGSYNKKYNPCAKRNDCKSMYICSNCVNKPGRICKSCKYVSCHNICPEFIEEKCVKLQKPPYVCNGCTLLNKCSLKKRKYDYIKAQNMYEIRLRESRIGIIIDEKEVDRLNKLFYPLVVEQNQSIHHVYIYHKDEIMFSEKTIYKIIDSGILKIKNIDLELKVIRRPRKAQPKVKVDKKCREGRTFDDFNQFMAENENNISTVQIDTVEGEKGGKVLLTIHFENCHLMLAFIRDYNDSKSVTNIFNELYKILGHDLFVRLFPVLLTDNGSEFSNPTAIEFTEDGTQRTKVFYCDPGASWQKSECERNHRFIRKISPKGKSMDHLNQEDINKMMSHINSYARSSINDLTPIDMFEAIYGKGILNRLNIVKIHHDEINLSPSLLRTNNNDDDR